MVQLKPRPLFVHLRFVHLRLDHPPQNKRKYTPLKKTHGYVCVCGIAAWPRHTVYITQPYDESIHVVTVHITTTDG